MARILVIANLNRDRSLKLDRPLIAGGRHSARTTADRIGGAGANAGTALAWAGHEVALAASVGDDAAGDRAIATVAAEGIDTRRVTRRKGPTQSFLVLNNPDGERTLILTDPPEPHRPDESVADEAWDAVLVNSRRPDLGTLLAKFPRSTMILSEYPRYADGPWPADVVVASAGDIPALGNDPLGTTVRLTGGRADLLVVTRGAEGAVAHDPTARPTRVPAYPATVVDTTGAGDVFAAGLLDALLKRLPLADALSRAARFASFAVSAEGSMPPRSLKDWLDGAQG